MQVFTYNANAILSGSLAWGIPEDEPGGDVTCHRGTAEQLAYLARSIERHAGTDPYKRRVALSIRAAIQH